MRESHQNGLGHGRTISEVGQGRRASQHLNEPNPSHLDCHPNLHLRPSPSTFEVAFTFTFTFTLTFTFTFTLILALTLPCAVEAVYENVGVRGEIRANKSVGRNRIRLCVAI